MNNIGSMQELLELIRREQSGFSASSRLVAAYVVENAYEVPFLSITQLSQNIGVSDSSVIKFCNQLGYRKFGDFKKALSRYAQGELVMSNKLSQTDSQEDSGDYFRIEAEEDTALIQTTLSDPNNRTALEKLLPMVDRAEHIYVTAGRASGYVSGLLVNALRYLGLKVHELDFGHGDYWDKLSMITDRDLVICISMPRYTAQILDALASLRATGIPIALITDTGLSPAVAYCDPVFYCSATSGNYFPNFAGCLALVNVILRAVSAHRKDRASAHISSLERKLIEQGVFR